MSKLLTVVVPTYNMESFLERCLSSFLLDEKHMAMLEIIVVNDGSKDHSSDIAHGFESRFPDTFRVIDKENGNYGSCINRGFKEATGTYFRILDADDWYDTGALASFLDKLANCESDLVVTPFNFITDKAQLFTFSDNVSTEISIPIESVCPEDIVNRMHSMTYGLKVLKECELFISEGVSYSDTEYCFFPLKSVRTVSFIRDIVYQYNAAREGQTCSSSALAKSTHSLYVVNYRLLQFYLDEAENVNDVVRKVWQRLLIQITQLYYQTSLLFCGKDDDENLRMTDELVKKIPFLNEIIGNRRRHSVKYVNMWRCCGRRYSLSWPCRFHDYIWESFVPGIKCFFKKHFGHK